MRNIVPEQAPLRIEEDGARVRALIDTAEYNAALYYYPAGLRHPLHEHDAAGLTFLLSGGFADDWEGRESTPSGSRYGFRPQGARHACRFGRDGALILSVALRQGCNVVFDPYRWQFSGPTMARLYGLLFAQAAPIRQVIDDLVAAAAAPEDAPTGTGPAPRWLRLAAEEIRDDPAVEIAAVALRAGVHRVHLSRAFQAHFGFSPTHFRLHCKAAAATRHMIENGEPPGMASVAAGFADQAHWTRTSRALAGLTPGKLRLLLAA